MISRLIASIVAPEPYIGVQYQERDSGPFSKNVITPLEIKDGFVEYESRYYKNDNGIKCSCSLSQFNWSYQKRKEPI